MNNVSVVIPTICSSHLRLMRSIDSVLSQERSGVISSIELIVANNSNNDLSFLQEKYCDIEFLTVVDASQKTGVSYARNVGVEHAKYPFIAFLDDDDYWDPSILQKLVITINNKDVHMTVCGFWSVGPNGIAPWKVPTDNIDIQEIYRVNPGFTGSNFLIKKSAYRELGGFDENLRTSNDKDFLIRFIQSDYSYAVVNDRLVYMDNTKHNRLSQVDEVKIQSAESFYRKHYDTMDQETRRNALFKIEMYSNILHRNYFGMLQLIAKRPSQWKKVITSFINYKT